MKLIYLKSTLKCNSLYVTSNIKFSFLHFCLLLSQVTPYYSLLPQTVWPSKSSVPVINLKTIIPQTMILEHRSSDYFLIVVIKFDAYILSGKMKRNSSTLIQVNIWTRNNYLDTMKANDEWETSFSYWVVMWNIF